MRKPPFAERRSSAIRENAFTLIELLTVITIIAVLMGLLFPAFSAVKNSANGAKARNDLVQLVSAVKNYNVEYGRYPVVATVTGTADFYYGPLTSVAVPPAAKNKDLVDVLRGVETTATPINSRGIKFLEVADVKSGDQPKGGIATKGAQTVIASVSVPVTAGDWVDPWGVPYTVFIDNDYDNAINVKSYYGDLGSSSNLGVIQIGVGAASLGKDGAVGKGGNFQGSDDVLSWQ